MKMERAHPRALELARTLGLAPHPEGGWYREMFRSYERVVASNGRERSALSVIHFLLVQGMASRLHRVQSDEVWTWLEGSPLELVLVTHELESVSRVVVGPISANLSAVHVVRAETWQGARSLGPYTLVACMVGPGFEFEDFSLIDEHQLAKARLANAFPDLAPFLSNSP